MKQPDQFPQFERRAVSEDLGATLKEELWKLCLLSELGLEVMIFE